LLRENFKNQQFNNAGGPDRNAEVAVGKGKKRKLERHPIAKPMPGMGFDGDDDDEDL
jgi:hypothetical protein